MSKNFYCPMPWHGAFLTPTRQSVCCGHTGLDITSVEEFFHSQHVRDLRQTFEPSMTLKEYYGQLKQLGYDAN